MVQINCKICGEEFYARPSNIKRGKAYCCSNKCRNESMKTGKYIDCSNCGKSVYKVMSQIKKSSSGNLYCSRSCKSKHFNNTPKGENHPNWKGGLASYRRRALRNGEEKCCNENCPLSDKDLPLFMLEVDHINGSKEDSSLENLQILCVWCHREKTIKNKDYQGTLV